MHRSQWSEYAAVDNDPVYEDMCQWLAGSLCQVLSKRSRLLLADHGTGSGDGQMRVEGAGLFTVSLARRNA